ncbi:hypothetical protein MTBPR1_60200 [Candidatus Terasakiella magnetica]|uniref:Uncharacterized protein n=1 Tax=Candidatus Terasakiella magnetica TaxID=1867952 RepID=A0A1C3RKA3_9PROT|nr:hypothetical protein MTBPR1_60200 [Candidatus Terasakiella magnetica]
MLACANMTVCAPYLITYGIPPPRHSGLDPESINDTTKLDAGLRQHDGVCLI